MVKYGIGLDIGSTATKVAVGQVKGTQFFPIKAAVFDGTVSETGELAGFLNSLGLRGGAMLGVTGKDMIIRYTQVTPMPDWQLKQVMTFEINDLAVQAGATQAGGGLSADFNRLAIASSLSEDDTILLTLIKDSLLEDQMSMLDGSKVRAEGFTPNAIALYNLLCRTADINSGTSLVLGIGADNIDLAIVQDGILIFARNLAGGSNLFNQALMSTFNLSFEKAERVKTELGCVLSRSGGGDMSPQQEKVGRTLIEPAHQIFSMVQSSLMFCKAQIKVTDLALDRVYITGGGARLKGLDASLSESFGVPVLFHDPAVELDITQLDNASEFVQQGPELSCALGLAVMAATPDHYAIHVMPEAEKKRRFFRTHTVFGILAAVLLIAFLGIKFSVSMADAGVLEKDKRTLSRELRKRESRSAEIKKLADENARLAELINEIDERTISTVGLVRTFALIQQYLPDDLWIQSVEVSDEILEESESSGKKPVIRLRGSGKEMGQPLQTSFTAFRKQLDADPLTRHVIPQVRYGDEFSFSLLISYTLMPETAGVNETDREDEEGDE